MHRSFLLIVLFPLFSFSQPTVQRAAAPNWVTPVSYPEIASDTLQSGGYVYLLFERQYNIPAQESYSRSAIQVLTEKGLEYASSIRVNFDPSFQKLIFHSVIVKRGQQKIDKLKTHQFEILRREENLDRLVYDKSLDAILNLEDVQVGDIVEYNYTIKGYNPVFSNKFSKTIYFNYSDPISKVYTRMISNRPLNFKSFNDAPNPIESKSGTTTAYVWELDSVPALSMDDKTPSWYDPFSNVEVTEHANWKAVNDWALPLYSTKSLASPDIDKKIETIKASGKSLDKQILEVVRFVQDEIRYLSFSDGIRGYKPHSPVKVFAQRFGDCKDKSLLLCFMLQKLGVESHPALVNTDYGKQLDKSLPSPLLFDHCITEFVLNDTLHWIDPTITLQRGSLRNNATPDYFFALIISDKTEGLTPIAPCPIIPSVKVQEKYSFRRIGGGATLKVNTTYQGGEANYMRSYWKSNSSEEIKKNYTNFYANDYPDIRMEGYVGFSDDEEENILTTVEVYSIGDFWRYDSMDRKQVAEFYARVVANSLDRPSTKTRTMPYGISHPTAIDQTIVIDLTESWNVQESKHSFSSPAFEYHSKTDYIPNRITLEYSYRSLQDYVDANDTKKHLEQIENALNDLSYQISYGEVEEDSSGFSKPFFVACAIVAAMLFFAFRASRRS